MTLRISFLHLLTKACDLKHVSFFLLNCLLHRFEILYEHHLAIKTERTETRPTRATGSKPIQNCLVEFNRFVLQEHDMENYKETKKGN